MTEKNKFNLLIEKIIFFQDINQKTILNCQKNKLLEIINTNDFNLCTEKLYEMNSKLLILKMNIYTYLKDDIGKIYATISSGDDVTERSVKEQELARKSTELESINQLMVGRELKMVELKKEIALLKNKYENTK